MQEVSIITHSHTEMHVALMEVKHTTCGAALGCIAYESNLDLFEDVPRGPDYFSH